MKTVYKYLLQVVNYQAITNIPVNAQILSIQIQGNQLCLWALVNPDEEKGTRVIECAGTGHPMPVEQGIEREYITTIQDGSLVWHFFEITKCAPSFIQTLMTNGEDQSTN